MLMQAVAAEFDNHPAFNRTGELLLNDLKRQVWDAVAPPPNPLEGRFPKPFATLLEGKLVSQNYIVLSKWHGQTVEHNPPIAAEVHLLTSGRGLGTTVFTDGSRFVDGGVGFGSGPTRYQPSPVEVADEDSLRSLGLTNKNTGLIGDTYWVETGYVKARARAET